MSYLLLLRTGFILASITGSISAFTQSLNPFVVGTVAPGDSIVIYYDVTINASCGCIEISNQGTISGANFSSFVTDDPKTGTPNDPTITRLNLFPLPASLLAFKGRLSNSSVALEWEVEEHNIGSYEIERSGTTASFTKIATVASAGNGRRSYTAIDPAPFAGTNFYRLKMIETDGSFKYSAVIAVNTGLTQPSVIAFPNPVVGGNLTLRLNNLPQDEYVLEVFSPVGQLVFKKQVVHQGGSSLVNVQLPPAHTGVMSVQLRGKKASYRQRLLFY